jgi:hypothetical protein
MSENEIAEALARKLRAIASVLLDPAATEHEKANARALRDRLERRLARVGGGSRSKAVNLMFRLGRAVREVKQSGEHQAPKGDWTDHAFRLGRFLRGLKK